MSEIEEGKKHSLLAPSSSSKWIACPGSIQKCKDLPRKQSGDAALRGTRIHYLGEMILSAYIAGNDNWLQRFDDVKDPLVGDKDCGKPFKIEADMLREAKNYAQYCIDLTKHYDTEECLIIAELNVDLSDIAPNTAGHADAIVITPNSQIDVGGHTMHVIDLKTGAGLVSAVGNSQGRLYAYGAFLEYELDYEITEVIVHIYQQNARAGMNISKEALSTTKLLEWIDNVAKPAAVEAMKEDAKCIPGEKQCEWCDAASFCKEAHEFGTALVLDMFETIEDQDPEIKADEASKHCTINEAVKFLEGIKFINGLAKAYSSRIEDSLNQGIPVKGYKLVLSKHNRKWVNELEAYNKLKKWAPLDEVAPRKLATPNQIETILGNMSTAKKNKFNEMWTKPEGRPVMAPESDKRPEVKAVIDDFENIEEDDFLD